MNHEETPLQVVRMSSELAVIEIQRERKRDVCMKWTSKPQKGERICITLVTFAVICFSKVSHSSQYVIEPQVNHSLRS